MDVKNCTRCGKIYIHIGIPICRDCKQEDEEDFQSIKNFLKEEPGASIKEVEDGTGVDSKKIIEFLKEGRLEVTEANNLFFNCERCGSQIKTGRFCQKCTADMDREFNQAIGGKKSKNPRKSDDVGKIRIIDRYRKEK